jgi:hypothetical protein
LGTGISVFTLGIYWDVSHALVDGLARAGEGFSQVIVDERDGMETKVMRMIKGALSVYVRNYWLSGKGNLAMKKFPLLLLYLRLLSCPPHPRDPKI